MPPDSSAGTVPHHHITFHEAFWIWVKVAIYSFGGPAGQIAVMHRLLVEEKHWIGEKRFLHALNYCMLLPGPEAQQLTIYIGWLLHGTKGGLVAGILFVIPGFVSILVLSILYAGFRELPLVEGLFYGLKPAVMAVVAAAVFRIGSRALKNRAMIMVAGLAFAAIFLFNVPFPLIILAAAGMGYLGGRWDAQAFAVIGGHSTGDTEQDEVAIGDQLETAGGTQPSVGRAVRVLATWLTIWFAPLVFLAAVMGRDSVFTAVAVFFSKAAVVTFGGAYAVLAYITQQAVETYAWLQPGEMLDGLGMAETTPGPLIQVTQFVGYMAAYRNPEVFDPLTAGILGAIVTTWVTFVPCFLWIFLGAPYIEYLRSNQMVTAALSGITAAVVGVILNLAVWFSLHTVFAQVDELHVAGMTLLVPFWHTVDWASLLIGTGAFIALFRWKMNMIPTLLFSAVLGLLYHLVTHA